MNQLQGIIWNVGTNWFGYLWCWWEKDHPASGPKIILSGFILNDLFWSLLFCIDHCIVDIFNVLLVMFLKCCGLLFNRKIIANSITHSIFTMTKCFFLVPIMFLYRYAFWITISTKRFCKCFYSSYFLSMWNSKTPTFPHSFLKAKKKLLE